MAIDYRIRYSFSITPSRQLTAYTGAHMLPYQVGDDGHLVEGPYSLELIEPFFTHLDALLETIQPVRRRLEAEAEQALARYCFVLGLFEEVYRSHRYMDGPLIVPAPRKSVEELLALPENAWIDDLCTVSTLFYDNYHQLLSLPFNLNPTFAGSSDVGGADADIIIDGQLIEIKASILPKISSSWLYQLVGYVLLDYDDHHHFHSVGIYMARQGLLLTWPLMDFVHLLTGNDQISLTQLRQEFRTVCQQQSKRQR